MENTWPASESPTSGEVRSGGPDLWRGVRSDALHRLRARDYSIQNPASRLRGEGVAVSELLRGGAELREVWIPGVEVFHRQVFQQKGRGYFAELARLDEGLLQKIGLMPRQWSSALMQRQSAKGFHIHPPHIPDGVDAGEWLRSLYLEPEGNYSKRPYLQEQWDLMCFLTGLCEIILVDERQGLSRKVMRFIIAGDSRPGPENAGIVIPPGVAHALRNIGNEDVVMVYGTSTSFRPDWEGRIADGIEKSALPDDWQSYLQGTPHSSWQE